MNIYLHYEFLKNFYFKIQNSSINKIIIAISGGQDSICLIKLIESIQKSIHFNLKITYLYIDHQWKITSKIQIQHIVNYIKSYQDDIIIYQVKNLPYSETEARKYRYEIIFNHANNYNYELIITGHSLTDKIETCLQKIFRGTSLNGITSLNQDRYIKYKFHLYRPLLNISRHDIKWFCQYFCLPIWSDTTNYYYNIKRNRLRYELVPYLKNYFHPNIEKNINSFLHISNIDNEYIKQNVIKIYLWIRHKKNIAINHQILKKQHLAIQQRIIYLFFFHNFNLFINQEIIYNILVKVNQCNYIPDKISWTIKQIYIEQKWLYIT
uniref:tRNA(Ile)-lysidine synthase n=1 Tax=Antithamnion hubbsii TaxID=1005974 RepID=A0A4D6WS65_9FLOR|nr:tRNA Ile-lysidine synthetase [Antithamnion hubbsii]